MKHYLFGLSLVLVFGSCANNSSSTGKPTKASEESKPITEDYFFAEKIGWKIKLPGSEWETISGKEKQKMHTEGKKIVEESMGTKIDDSDVKELISFRKDKFNNFMATIEPFNKSMQNQYDGILANTHELIKKTYALRKIKADYEIGASRIDGLMVDKFDIKLYSPNKKDIILYQHVYSCLVNNYVLTINISANNLKDEEALLNVIYSSKFSAKN